eukprot:Nitzschia sp. Nitz4//scaffold78_size91513//48498//49280//NITZ4_004928-RA/size91513-processed-gene-0.65-mRNA-1//1//CDS//3329558127//547//frame0
MCRQPKPQASIVAASASTTLPKGSSLSSKKISFKGLVATLKEKAKHAFEKEDSSIGSCTEESTVGSKFSHASHHSNKKRVSFSKKVRVSMTMGRHDLTDEEYANAWYHQSEFLDIADDCFALVKQAKRGELAEIPRGLERLSKVGMKQAMENRKASIYLVLDEQDQQIMDRIYDDDYTAYLYHNVTSSSQLWATVVGSRDQKEAEAAYDDDDVHEVEFDAFAQYPSSKDIGLKGILVAEGARKSPKLSEEGSSIKGARAA